MGYDAKLEVLLAAKNATDQAFDKFKRNVDGASSAFGIFKAGLVGLGAGVSLDAILHGLDTVIDKASDTTETLSKVNTLFGEKESSNLEQWAQRSAVAMGMSSQAALDVTGTMGNMFLQLGAGIEKSSRLSQSMVQLSADLSSFHNVSGGSIEVLAAMQSAFRGEYDALQRYIPTINAAAVQQQALATTGKESKDELTDLEKAMAAITIITRDAGAATGDFLRTSKELANQERILSAHFENIQAKIGKELLPTYSSGINRTNEWIEKNNEFTEEIKAVSEAFDLMVKTITTKGPSAKTLLKGFFDSTPLGQFVNQLRMIKTEFDLIKNVTGLGRQSQYNAGYNPMEEGGPGFTDWRPPEIDLSAFDKSGQSLDEFFELYDKVEKYKEDRLKKILSKKTDKDLEDLEVFQDLAGNVFDSIEDNAQKVMSAYSNAYSGMTSLTENAYNYFKSVYEDDREAFIKLTGDKETAMEIYTQKIDALFSHRPGSSINGELGALANLAPILSIIAEHQVAAVACNGSSKLNVPKQSQLVTYSFETHQNSLHNSSQYLCGHPHKY